MKEIGERILLDSSAWLSYFLAENESSKDFIENGKHLLMTSISSIFEVKRKMLIKKIQGSKIEEFLKFIRNRSLLIELNESICGEAADISVKHNLHTVDSLIYCSAILNNAILISGDRHFDGLENVLILK